MSRTVYAVFYTVREGVGIELRCIDLEEDHVALAAQVGKKNGHDLMFVFSIEPDMEKVKESVQVNAGLARLPGYEKLFVLQPEKDLPQPYEAEIAGRNRSKIDP